MKEKGFVLVTVTACSLVWRLFPGVMRDRDAPVSHIALASTSLFVIGDCTCTFERSMREIVSYTAVKHKPGVGLFANAASSRDRYYVTLKMAYHFIFTVKTFLD